ncbi:hypothetical protein CsatB_024019 [Cannabis sativa]
MWMSNQIAIGLWWVFQARLLFCLSLVKLQYFIELRALFEDVIALLSKLPGAVLSHGARSKILAAHGW